MVIPSWLDDVILIGAFIAVQGLSAIAFFAIRYHFKLFALPGNLFGVRRLLGICALGILFGCMVSAWFTIQAIS